MGLKSDLQDIFENGVANETTIEDTAAEITAVYEDAVKAGSDSLNNAWQLQLFPAVEQAIIAQFTLAQETKQYLQFTLIELALVASWAPALLKLPATHPAMSQVIIGNVIVSVPPGTPPLTAASDNYDPIVNAFYNMFTLHAKSLNFLYTGLALPTPATPPLALPVPLFTIT